MGVLNIFFIILGFGIVAWNWWFQLLGVIGIRNSRFSSCHQSPAAGGKADHPRLRIGGSSQVLQCRHFGPIITKSPEKAWKGYEFTGVAACLGLPIVVTLNYGELMCPSVPCAMRRSTLVLSVAGLKNWGDLGWKMGWIDEPCTVSFGGDDVPQRFQV